MQQRRASASRGGCRGGLAESFRVGPWTRVLLSGSHGRRPSVHIRSGGPHRQVECAEANGRRCDGYDRARWRASWRGSRRAGRVRRPCWRWLGVRRRSARSRLARIGTGAGMGTVSRRGFWPPGAPRVALVRHPVAGVPGRVSLVAPWHGARAVARPSAHRRPVQSPDVWCRASPGHRPTSRYAGPLPVAGCLSRMARVDTRQPIHRAPVAEERARHGSSSLSSPKTT